MKAMTVDLVVALEVDERLIHSRRTLACCALLGTACALCLVFGRIGRVFFHRSMGWPSENTTPQCRAVPHELWTECRGRGTSVNKIKENFSI